VQIAYLSEIHYKQMKLALGLYSALRAWSAIVLRSNLQSKLTVDTIFLDVQTAWLLNHIKRRKTIMYANVNKSKLFAQSKVNCKQKQNY